MSPAAPAPRPDRLADKRILIVGAASGIGRATAVRVAAEGARAALFDVAEDADALLGDCGPDARYWRCDVSDEQQVEPSVAEAVEWLGGLDAVLHVAGIVRDRLVPVDELATELWTKVLDVNLTGPFLIAKHATPHLERSRGVLVLTGSGAGIFNGHSSLAYGTSKGGVHGLALTLEEPLRARGIRVNDVAPGGVATPLLEPTPGDRTPAAQPPARDKPPAELTSPDEVAAIMAFLASDEASAVRGTVRTW